MTPNLKIPEQSYQVSHTVPDQNEESSDNFNKHQNVNIESKSNSEWTDAASEVYSAALIRSPDQQTRLKIKNIKLEQITEIETPRNKIL